MSSTGADEKTPRSKATREWLQLGLIIFATVSGFYQFILKDIIRPAQEPTALNINASLEQVGEKDGLLLIRSHIAAHNPTKRRIYIPAYWFTVTGYRLADGAAAVNSDHGAMLEELDRSGNGGALVSTYAPPDGGEIVAQQRITYQNSAWWEPEDKTNDESIFAVPKGKFDFLVLNVIYLHTRNDADIDDPVWHSSEAGLWSAQFRLKPHMDMNVEEWQRTTGSGYSWYTTALPLAAAK